MNHVFLLRSYLGLIKNRFVFSSVLTLFFCLLFNTAFAQTKLIAHKSHSGNVENFKKSLTHDLFDIECSNFGVAPTRVVENADLDSLIFISDWMAVMVTSNHCTDTYTDKHSLWRAGRDTVYHHALFSKQHSLDSIKLILQQQYFFNNPIDETIFIGYDNSENQQQQQGQH